MIYFDNAASSFPKPPSVTAAMRFALGHTSGAGRSSHALAMTGAELMFQTRCEAAQLFGVSDPSRIVFTHNATHALNIALRSAGSRFRRIAISPFEHNSVFRPLHAMRRQVRTTILDGELWNDERLLSSAERALKSGVECFVLTHVSNVFGAVQPLAELDALLAPRGIPLILDASQSAGVLELDVRNYSSLAAVCMPGHKGLYGPTGTGILICCDERFCHSILQGGTGGDSAEADMPDYLPDRLESGTANVCGIAGLRAGIRFVRSVGTESIRRKECALLQRFRPLAELDGVQCFFAPIPGRQTGVLSLRLNDLPAEQAAAQLAEYGICVRAGLHCAPLAHRTAHTFESGTVRFSFGWFQTEGQAEAAVRVLKSMLKSTKKE